MRSLTRPLILVLLVGCGSEPEPVATPEPTPEPTATPAPLLVGQLLHVVFEEAIAAPALPLRSPLHRDAAASAVAPFPTAEALAADGAADALVSAWTTLLSDGGASGERVALVQWSVAWGADGESGTARQWGLCSLPCTIEDPFVADASHLPADPLRAPGALFAGRPGATALTLSWGSDFLEVRHGDGAMSMGTALTAEDSLTAPNLQADLASLETVTRARRRSLRWVATSTQELPATADAAPQPSVTTLFPSLRPGQGDPVRRAVEAVPEIWLWPDAERFTGGYSVKPDPSAAGITLQREQRRILWTPRGRDTTVDQVGFPTFQLSRDGTFGSISPFPLGASVLPSVAAADGAAVVANRGTMEEVRRAEFVAEKLAGFADKLPLAPAGEEDTPWVIYLDSAPLTAVEGGAGSRPWSPVVSIDGRETDSIREAWARLALGPHGIVRSAAVDDWVESVQATLQGADDPSLWTRVFATAGDDVAAVWRENLVKPEDGGSPDPLAFLGFVRRQIPALAAELSWQLALRAFVLDRDPITGAPIDRTPAGDDDDSARPDALAEAGPEATPEPTPEPTPPPKDPTWVWSGEADPARAVLLELELPRAARLGVLVGKEPTVVPRWAVASLPEGRSLDELLADPAERVKLVEGLKEVPTGVDLLAGPAVVVVESAQAWSMTLALDSPVPATE